MKASCSHNNTADGCVLTFQFQMWRDKVYSPPALSYLQDFLYLACLIYMICFVLLLCLAVLSLALTAAACQPDPNALSASSIMMAYIIMCCDCFVLTSCHRWSLRGSTRPETLGTPSSDSAGSHCRPVFVYTRTLFYLAKPMHRGH